LKYKNYYKILGLDSSRASDEDIRLAYRKLAKQYHPDVNPNDEIAAERFKDINEAYQILGNEDSKRKYDRIHFAYRIKDSFNVKDGVSAGGFSDFINMFVGKAPKQNVVTNLNKDDDKDLPVPGENLESEIEITLDEAFNGTEKKLAFRQTNGKLKTISVKIPKGIRNGSKVRIAEQGKPGKNGGKTGDLFVKVKIAEHERYKLDGTNFIIDLPITPWEAVLGCKMEVQNIDSNILITVPAGTQSGEKLRIANNGYYDGYGGRGDLLLNVRIVVPKELTKEEEVLFNKLKQISRFSPRGN
jgi:curved DNA-binding protein